MLELSINCVYLLFIFLDLMKLRSACHNKLLLSNCFEEYHVPGSGPVSRVPILCLVPKMPLNPSQRCDGYTSFKLLTVSSVP